MIKTLTIALVALCAPVAMGTTDAMEDQLVATAEAESGRALDLIREVVDINSGTLNLEGVRQVGEIFQREFDALGFDTRWIDGEAFERAGHLVAERPGDGSGPKILLIGHLDTVFEPDSPFQRFERRDPRHAAGPGITDMKGGNVVMVHALRALAAHGALDALAIRVVLTGDEEKRGQPIDVATEALIEAGRWADIAIGFEDGDGDPTTAVVARRGSSNWELTVTGKPAHSSQIFREDIGAGAIFEAARILDRFRESLSDLPDLTFNPGLILGGTEAELDPATARGEAFGKSNVIAERARIRGDLRALTVDQREAVKGRMQAIVDDHLPHTSAELRFEDNYPPMGPTDGNRRLLALYDSVSRDLGDGPVAAVDPRRAGAADISFVAAHVDMALDGVGLMGEGGHTVDEMADLDTLPMQIRRAAVLLWRLSKGLR